MDDQPVDRPGLIARLLADPIRLRRGSRLVLLGLLALVIVSQLLSGPGGGML